MRDFNLVVLVILFIVFGEMVSVYFGRSFEFYYSLVFEVFFLF